MDRSPIADLLCQLTASARVAALLAFTGLPVVAFGVWASFPILPAQAMPSSEARADTHGSAATWVRLTANAGFPGSYNFPVHVTNDGRFVALHPSGTWISRDGRSWIRSRLPWSGMNSAYLKYVQHNGATWALGTLRGNYLDFTVDPVIRLTSNYQSWDTVGRSTSLPQRVFYGAVSFRGAMWLVGGYTPHRMETAEVWRSTDGLHWQLVTSKAPWSPRASPGVVVFRDRLYLVGGYRIDGPQANDVWSTGDGVAWRRETDHMTDDGMGGTVVAFGDQLWQVGANRSGVFASAVLVSDDGATWRHESAPWSPRGGVAAWARNDSLFMTGGKFSTISNGEQVFTYSNDVWVRSR